MIVLSRYALQIPICSEDSHRYQYQYIADSDSDTDMYLNVYTDTDADTCLKVLINTDTDTNYGNFHRYTNPNTKTCGVSVIIPILGNFSLTDTVTG